MTHGVFGPAILVKFQESRSSHTAAEKFEAAALKHPDVHTIERTDPDENGEEEVDVYPHHGVDFNAFRAEMTELFNRICNETFAGPH